MKKFLHFIQMGAIALFVMTASPGKSQSITGTVLTQPCNNNGKIGVTTSGLTPPINFTYNNWATNQTITHTGVTTLTDNLSGLPAYQDVNWVSFNNWQVTASDGVNSAVVYLTLTPAFSDTIKMSPGTCPSPSTLEATNFAGGTAPYTVVWTNTNTNVTYISNPAQVPIGTYTLVITDAAGCMVSSAPSNTGNIQVTNISNIMPNASGTSANCSNGTAGVMPSGGTAPYTYLWSNGATTQNISGLTMGLYNCIVTDAMGCQSIGYQYINQAVTINYNSSVTNATCLQNNGGILSFISGGTAPYTFLWSNGATTQNVSALVSGYYQVQITDANGCLGQGGAYVSATTPISVTYTASPSSCTSPTGSATLTATGGTAPYSIVWNIYPTSTTGTSITNKPSGSYPFTITDANGCVQHGSAYIPPASTLIASAVASSPVCPATLGNVYTSVSGSNGPFTYLWSNAATTSSLTNVGVGPYTCTVTDAVGCHVVKYAYVSTSNPISVGYSASQASCLYASDGSVLANAFGGTAPYTYVWSNSQTGATATGLGTGYYSVYVTDANGCHNNYSSSFVGYNAANNSCYCTITGTVYADANTNCIRNAGEAGIPNIQIHCSGMGYVYTDANGVYSFQVPSGTYTITESVQQMYPLTSCQANGQTVTVTAASNCVTNVDFSNIITPIHDLHIITTNVNWPIPGNTYTQKVIVQNDGSVTENNIKIGYTHDGQLGYSSCTPWALTRQNPTTYPNWYSITSGFTSLGGGASSTTYINYNVPTNIPLNTQVNFYDTVASAAPIATSWLTDNTPWNNVNNNYAYVVGSFDPNFKEVSPKGTGPQGYITSKDSMLTYVIHFQNTGSSFAQNIVVVDTLDSDLNIKSLRPGYADHNYETTMSDNGVIKFHFSNINLPWQSAYGDMMSSGMVSYSVKMKPGLAMGTQIKNKAAIYFDYNDPIITNSTLNTLHASTVTSVSEIKKNKDLSSLYPNPTSGHFTLAFTSTESSNGALTITDISGREVLSNDVQVQAGDNTVMSSTSGLTSGIYLVQLKTNNMTITKKLVVAK